jgi:hypothetical protein
VSDAAASRVGSLEEKGVRPIKLPAATEIRLASARRIMSIAPFEQTFSKDGTCAPEIQLLEIRPSDAPDARDPCAWVYVRREEKSVRDTGSKDIAEASITLSYQAVDARVGYATRAGGSFTASYSRAINRISNSGACTWVPICSTPSWDGQSSGLLR